MTEFLPPYEVLFKGTASPDIPYPSDASLAFEHHLYPILSYVGRVERFIDNEWLYA
jgi:hypothetical protein